MVIYEVYAVETVGKYVCVCLREFYVFDGEEYGV